MTTVSSTDLVVAGGGVIGLTVAWRAAAAGLTVTVVDPDPDPPPARLAAQVSEPSDQPPA